MAALPGGTDVTITHKFVSGKADGGDGTLVQPSKWNQNENVGAGADGQKMVRDAGQTDGGSWVNYDSASFTNSTGSGAAVGDVVAVSVAVDNAVVLDDTVSSLRKFVVALQTPANAAVGAYAFAGPVPGVKAQGSIAAGQYVRKSATAKAVEDAGVAVNSAARPPSDALGFATSAAAGGFVNIFLFGQPAGSRGSVIQYTNPTALSTANTYYAGGSVGFQTADPNLGKVPVPFAGVAKNLRCFATSAPAGGSLVFTLMVDGVDTALTATMGAAQTTASDLTHAVTIAAGQVILMKMVKTGTDNMDIGVSFEFA